MCVQLFGSEFLNVLLQSWKLYASVCVSIVIFSVCVCVCVVYRIAEVCYSAVYTIQGVQIALCCTFCLFRCFVCVCVLFLGQQKQQRNGLECFNRLRLFSCLFVCLFFQVCVFLRGVNLERVNTHTPRVRTNTSGVNSYSGRLASVAIRLSRG